VFHRLAKHFDVVIIDEAAQAVEPSVMVPLVMGCKQVGRSNQGQLQPALQNNAAIQQYTAQLLDLCVHWVIFSMHYCTNASSVMWQFSLVLCCRCTWWVILCSFPPPSSAALRLSRAMT
jgi:hypothetical protein